MKVLIAGAGGQLGRALTRCAPQDMQVVALARAQFDIGRPEDIEGVVAAVRPDVLLNAAAYTAVDRAESESAQAHAINGAAVGTLARTCSRGRIRLVHVSTDFVFDGASGRPYAPHDPTNPLNVYGRSKLEGERRIAACDELDWRIVRTAWVYSDGGSNFVATMLRLFRERPLIRVVADQVGTPTSAASLAQCLWQAARDEGSPSILHYTDAGVASWYDFAVAIREEAGAAGLVERAVAIEPIGTDQYPTPARRPAYSVLEKRATTARLGLTPVHWRENLRAVLREWRK